jgi:hypothetical protein
MAKIPPVEYPLMAIVFADVDSAHAPAKLAMRSSFALRLIEISVIPRWISHDLHSDTSNPSSNNLYTQ